MVPELDVLLQKKSPSFGEILTALILGIRQAKTPNEKVAWLGAVGEMLQPTGLAVFAEPPSTKEEEPTIWLAIPDEHPALLRIFAGSPWASGGWGVALKQAPQAEAHTVEVDGQLRNCTMMSLSALASEFGMGEKKH